MGQIVKRRKKARQSDDFDLHVKSKSRGVESGYRRSLRRRNARPIIDYDDYLDEYEEEMMLVDDEEDEDDEDEDEEEEGEMRSSEKRRRRKKKKKLQSVVKLAEYESDSMPSRRGGRGMRETVEDDDDDYEAEAHNNVDMENDDDDENMEGGLKGDSREEESDPGTPIQAQIVVPLPDKKLLELILDKLQKKDIYGVYAEPVDPEELPDYFDIITHPMDFATVRKKLANGKYSTLDQIEKDVLLICSNAMQYNEPDTVYYKQARTIQEMARKKFDRVRSDFERSEKEKQINTEERIKFNHNRINPIRRSIRPSSQEPVGSDYLSGAAQSTPGESQNGLNLSRISSYGKPFCNDGPVEGNVSTMDNDVDKVEEFASAKNISCKIGKMPSTLDANRRSTYKTSNQLIGGSDSIFTTFEKEPKELISVGLQAEYSYARSLARFAGTLGPAAWNIAAKNIKEALSVGVRFGRGWVGEYEPISTPFLKVDSQCNLGSACPTALPDISHSNVKVNRKSRATGPINSDSCYSNKDHPVNEPVLEGRPPFIPDPDCHPTKRKHPSIGYDGRVAVSPLSSINLGKNPFSRNRINVGAKVGIQDVSFTSTANPDKVSFGTAVQLPKSSFVVTGGASQPHSKSMPFKKAESGGLVSGLVPASNVSMSTFEKNQLAGISSNVSHPAVRSPAPSGYGETHQGVSDPVQQIRMLAEKAQQNQQNFVVHSPASSSPAMPGVPSSRRYDINNGSQVSPRSWMSIGSNNIIKAAPESPRPFRNHISADSLYNPTRDVQQVSRFRGETPGSVGLHFQMENNQLANHGHGQENHWLAKEAQLQGHSVNMTKLVTADLSRFQVQSPRQSFGFRPQPRQTFPPDLNVGFQSSGSPARQGTQVDPQQPDLALQL